MYDFYRDFLLSQKEKEYDIDIPKDSFDVYDLAALAYIYKRIKETDPVREASHVVIDEAQDFWHDGILLSALLPQKLHIHYHGRYIAEYTF